MTMADKERLQSLLHEERYELIVPFVAAKKTRLSMLLSMSYTTDPLEKWEIVKAAGYASKSIAESDPAFVRTVIRNLLWSLNDDSGSVGWSSPELLGEIIGGRTDLFKEFVPMVVSLLGIKEDSFRAGVLWAMGTIALNDLSSIRPYAPYVQMYVQDSSPDTRGCAVWCLGRIRAEVPGKYVRSLLEDAAGIYLLDSDKHIYRKTIGEITREAIQKETT